jgi:hypothetical protein
MKTAPGEFERLPVGSVRRHLIAPHRLARRTVAHQNKRIAARPRRSQQHRFEAARTRGFHRNPQVFAMERLGRGRRQCDADDQRRQHRRARHVGVAPRRIQR